MIFFLAIRFTLLCFSIALAINLWRLLRGPNVSDRLLALDTMTVNVVAMLVLAGIYSGSSVYYEAALLYALFGFVSTVAFARFLKRELGE